MHTGLVTIAGAPNVGKSTFLNQVLGFKLAITADKPQTTRHRLLGVHTSDEFQIVFLDTPGLHQARSALNKQMVNTAREALEGVDLVLFMTDVSPGSLERSASLAPLLLKTKRPVIVALNKIDLVRRKQELLPLLEQVSSWGPWQAVVPISAQNGEGCSAVVKELAARLPESEPLFPADTLTDLPVRFLAGELIREKVFRLTGQEVPYSSAVTIDEFLEPAHEGGMFAITATIHVERSGQKAIVIGKGGEMVKRIGSAARVDLERLLGGKVFLDLLVRVEPKWARRQEGLRKLGY
jgi:GTP-binding protein Era